MVEYKFLIDPIFKSFSKLRKLGYKMIIQNSPFEYGVRIKNIGNVAFKGGLIRNIEITPLKSDVEFYITCDKEFKIPPLDPGDLSIIWFERISSVLSGQFWLEFDLKSKKKGKIITYQRGQGPIQESKDEWGDVFNIKDEHSLQQEITNYLIILLTILILLETVFGIKNILKGLLNILGF